MYALKKFFGNGKDDIVQRLCILSLRPFHAVAAAGIGFGSSRSVGRLARPPPRPPPTGPPRRGGGSNPPGCSQPGCISGQDPINTVETWDGTRKLFFKVSNFIPQIFSVGLQPHKSARFWDFWVRRHKSETFRLTSSKFVYRYRLLYYFAKMYWVPVVMWNDELQHVLPIEANRDYRFFKNWNLFSFYLRKFFILAIANRTFS